MGHGRFEVLWRVNLLVAVRAVVDVFLEASVEAEVTSQVIHGWSVEALAEQGEWLRVRTVDGYTGWALREGFREGFQNTEAEAGALRVAGSSANVYAEPDVKVRRALMQLPWEARLTELDREGTWVRVRLADGRVAFVHAGDVASAWPVVGVAESLAIGTRFLGVTYTWGGISSFGYDCSGFVQMMLRQRGIRGPRDAQAQMGWGGFESVALDAVEAGDVVFFGPTR